MSSILFIVLFIVTIAVIVFMKSRNSTKQDTDLKNQTPVSQGPSPKDQVKQILDSLIKLNLLVRKDAHLSNDLTLEIESIIDDLAAVAPAMMERYPGETLTYEIKKIGKEHLFKTVKEYLDLSAESRQHQLAVFQKTIESLHEVSKRSRDIVEKNETAEFKTMANFLAGKF